MANILYTFSLVLFCPLLIELPLFGCKVLGVRKGSLELHGKPINNTWTHLAQTAYPNDLNITVMDDISDWEVGDEIVIPSTSHR